MSHFYLDAANETDSFSAKDYCTTIPPVGRYYVNELRRDYGFSAKNCGDKIYYCREYGVEPKDPLFEGANENLF